MHFRFIFVTAIGLSFANWAYAEEPSKSPKTPDFLVVSLGKSADLIEVPGASDPAKNVIYQMRSGQYLEISDDADVGTWYSVEGETSNGEKKQFWVSPRAFEPVLGETAPMLKLAPSNGTAPAVFAKIGQGEKDCGAKKNCVIRPSKNTVFTLKGTALHRIFDPTNKSYHWQMFSKVEFKTSPSQTVVGWINSNFVQPASEQKPDDRTVPLAPAKVSPNAAEPDCTPEHTSFVDGMLRWVTTAARKGLDGAHEVRDLVMQKYVDDMTAEILPKLLPQVGKCLLPESKQAPTYAEGVSAFDETVMKDWKLDAKRFVTGPDGKTISRKNMIAIDTLARTLFGEMSVCFDFGKQNALAVARIALNRADYVSRPKRARSRKIFSRVKPDPLKSPMTEILTSPQQFSIWNTPTAKSPNNQFQQALCPPSRSGSAYYSGRNPTNSELENWKNSVAIATQAVLFPEQFKRLTNEVTQYYYTSHHKSFYSFPREYPKIKGTQLTKDKRLANGEPGCSIEVWKDIPPLK